MFHGDTDELTRTLWAAVVHGRRMQYRRIGSEHLLLALCETPGAVGQALRVVGATPAAVWSVIGRPGIGPAAVEADRAALQAVGIDDGVLREDAMKQFGLQVFDPRPRGRHLFPLGARRAEQRCAATQPPIGHDAQALYEASLRYALARRDRRHDVHHLLLAMLEVDRGVAWVLGELDADRALLMSAIEKTFPLRRGRLLMRIERRLAWRTRTRHIAQRYRLRTGG